MGRLIKVIRNKIIEYDKGKFDNWCVFVREDGKARYAPRDSEYFGFFRALSYLWMEPSKIYSDFVEIYDMTDKNINHAVLMRITEISDDYSPETEEADLYFTVIYAGMVAEENKERAILKKRIKRLGMHQVLIEDFEPDVAANFSRGKKWRELDSIMRTKGF